MVDYTKWDKLAAELGDDYEQQDEEARRAWMCIPRAALHHEARLDGSQRAGGTCCPRPPATFLIAEPRTPTFRQVPMGRRERQDPIRVAGKR